MFCRTHKNMKILDFSYYKNPSMLLRYDQFYEKFKIFDWSIAQKVLEYSA